ncbi:hypothetical protein ABZZ36_30280 [Actinacidiphila glaucinigra]|uniref:hypothetical protein n=1 Tax=Actinacidiphila glaucinigra TaxID=235986 RepID=UPI00339FB9FD
MTAKAAHRLVVRQPGGGRLEIPVADAREAIVVAGTRHGEAVLERLVDGTWVAVAVRLVDGRWVKKKQQATTGAEETRQQAPRPQKPKPARGRRTARTSKAPAYGIGTGTYWSDDLAAGRKKKRRRKRRLRE